jgi:hypothetical protein
LQFIANKEFFEYLKRRFYNDEIIILNSNKRQRKVRINMRPVKKISGNFVSPVLNLVMKKKLSKKLAMVCSKVDQVPLTIKARRQKIKKKKRLAI